MRAKSMAMKGAIIAMTAESIGEVASLKAMTEVLIKMNAASMVITAASMAITRASSAMTAA